MKAWKVLWLNIRRAAYITRPEEQAGNPSFLGEEEEAAHVEEKLPLGAWGGVRRLEGELLRVRGRGGAHPGPGGTHDLCHLLGEHQQVTMPPWHRVPASEKQPAAGPAAPTS